MSPAVKQHRLWIAGTWQESAATLDILAPYGQEKIAQAFLATEKQMEEAIRSAHEAFVTTRRLSRFVRSKLLSAMASHIAERRAAFVDLLVHEAGKPRTLADVEVSRAINTFQLAAEEVKRFAGSMVPVDLDAGARQFLPAQTQWQASGPVLAIAPFNFPLNLIAHKVAPALAVGTSVIIKPPPQAPGAAVLLAEIFAVAAAACSDAQEQIPLSMLQVVHANNDVTGLPVKDARISILSFTGSDHVGWLLKGMAPRKKVALELGGNAAVIIHEDADINRAAARCAFGGFAYAGQICISVQRILVHEKIAAVFQEKFLHEITRLSVGDPNTASTTVGPLIDRAAADRVMQWLAEARSDGAEVLCGGWRDGNVITPTVVRGAKDTHKISCAEVFGPVVTLDTYQDFSKALHRVNASRYGLQAGVFTSNISVAQQAYKELEVGAVIINDIPTFRADNMPYGGVKDSGNCREGVRYAMEEYCDLKTLVTYAP